MVYPALYHKLPSTGPTDFEDSNDRKSSQSWSMFGSVNRRPISTYIVVLVLSLSLLLNTLGGVFFMNAMYSGTSSKRSLFAGLERNVTRMWTYHGLYDSENKTEMDQAWNDINIDAGNVALGDSYVKAMGLLEAQRFPWDDSKGIYYLNGYHNLHCLKEIRRSYVRYQTGMPQAGDLGHIRHCFDALRQDILCNADDTPRYTGFQPVHSTGLMQDHQCRDWDRLEAWAKTNTACWRYTHDKGPDSHVVEQYQFCPPDSPYAARVTEVFGEE